MFETPPPPRHYISLKFFIASIFTPVITSKFDYITVGVNKLCYFDEPALSQRSVVLNMLVLK